MSLRSLLLLLVAALGIVADGCATQRPDLAIGPRAGADGVEASSLLAGIADPGPSPARPPQLVDPALRGWLSASIARCDRAVATVAFAEKRAYAERDVILVNALRDKNAALRSARRMMVERAAALRGSDDAAERLHESLVIDVLNHRVGVLVREARESICEYPSDGG